MTLKKKSNVLGQPEAASAVIAPTIEHEDHREWIARTATASLVELFEVPEEADEFDWNQDNFVRSALVSDEWRFTNGNPKPPVRMIKSPKLVKKQTALPSVSTVSRLAYVQAGGETRSGPRSSNDDEKCREVRFTFPMRNMQPSLACLDGSSVPDISSSHSTVVRPATEALPYRSSHTHNHAAPRYPASYRNPEEGTSNGHVDLVSGTHSLRHSFQLQGSGVGSGGELDPAVGMQRPFRRSLIQSSPIHQSLPLCSLRGTAERHSMPSISRSAEMVDDMLEITNTQRPTCYASRRRSDSEPLLQSERHAGLPSNGPSRPQTTPANTSSLPDLMIQQMRQRDIMHCPAPRVDAVGKACRIWAESQLHALSRAPKRVLPQTGLSRLVLRAQAPVKSPMKRK
eukprot:CAMPEP_0114281260 /NCGR_PEP_ID=MMETSP0059-20121206/2891_1 /TAXON_ID=36894 /ORGANISM="Pyramimonas parkeae, Strain CCMP726" /LENGTH=398 /DNA_ID=CAMNT_0001401745 /DNA_START=238 /DNA_END=1434 /DNA_ORIENTATION=-